MARQRFSCDEGYLHANPFLAKPSHPDDLNTSDMEPISMIDEEEFVRKFRDIALFAEVDDVEDDAVLLRATLGSRRKSDQHIQHKNFLASHQEENDKNAGFNVKLMDPFFLNSNQAVPPPPSMPSSTCSTPRNLSMVGATVRSSQSASPGFANSTKSFLDDDWLLNRVEHDSNMAAVASGLVRPRSAMSIGSAGVVGSKPGVFSVTSSASSSAALAFRSLNTSKSNSPIAEKVTVPPPSDYVCKLCNVSGHWLKDCHLFEPRPPSNQSNSRLHSFGHLRSLSSMSSNGMSSSNLQRSNLPPGNYVCRLCGVSGHWIDQCQMFQPKSSTQISKGLGSGNKTQSSFKSIPPPPGYICNLCDQPGHWLQQCSRFEPIVHHRPNRKDHR